MSNKIIAKELVKIASELVAIKKVKYRGYTIEESGMNYYVKDSKGHRAFGEVPASIDTAKKWIDMEIAEKGKKAKKLVAEEGQKEYYTMNNVGKAKYVVNYHDGVKTHKDGSQFYDIAIFSNKKAFESFIDDLEKQGYNEKR